MKCEPIIAPQEMVPIAYNGCPCISTEMLATAYEVTTVSIRKNFSANKDRFIEGKHFFTISGNDLNEFKNRVTESNSVHPGKNARSFTLWTERGAARHAKMLSSDKAWDVFELLEETFFNVKAEAVPTEPMTTVTSRKPLDKLVKVWAVRAAIPYQQAWTMLDSHFCLTDIKDLPLSKLHEAIAWVQARIDALPPEQPKALPAPKKDKYELFIEKLENVRQRREKEMTDLMSEALVLTQPLKWGLDHWHPICYATRKWVEQTINSPSKVGAFGDKELPIMFGKLADSVRFAAE